MSVFEIVILGLALAMDAFAVTISNSFAYPKISRARSLSMPLAFGFFQFLMPVVGFVLGQLVSDFITQYAGIITFAILGFIGGKMIWDAFHEEEGEEASEQTLTMPVLLFQAVATSIDALAMGVTFAFLQVNIAFAVLFIGVTTFVLSAVGLKIGNIFGARFKTLAERFGGAVLILMGVKILLEHLGVIAF